MHKNRNKKAVNRVSYGMLKANKSRNIFAVIAIILTAFMITTVFSLGMSYKENYDTFIIRQFGTIATISIDNPTDEQYEKIKSLDYLDAVGKQYKIGNITQKTPENTDSVISLWCYDKTEYENNFKPAISSIEGNYPLKANEIMMSEDALSQLGIDNPEINQTVELVYNTGDGSKSGEYKLSGWFKSYATSIKSIILFSEEYCENNGITLETGGKVNIFAKDDEAAYELLEKDISLNENQKINSRFTVSDINTVIKIAALVILIVLFIMMSGFLLIYNVFYISVSKEINRYGMLKTLGTSQKQIQKIIINQALLLGSIGIPAGLVLSAVFSLAIVPFTLNSIVSADFDEISFSPLIFIGAAVFSVATVFFSAWKPARMAGKISPVEAIRYNAVKTVKSKTIKKTKNGGKIYKMAWRNIFRSKKQTLLVVISLFLGSMTMLCINGLINSMDSEAYVNRYCKSDFAFINEAPIENEFSDNMIQSLKNIEGVKDFKVSRTAFINIEFDKQALEPILKNAFEEGGGNYSNSDYYNNFVETMQGLVDDGEFGAWVQTIDSDCVKEYNKNHKEQIDLQSFEDGKTVIYLGDGDYRGTELTFVDNSGKKSKVGIDGMFTYSDIDYIADVEMTMGMPNIIFVSETFMDNLEIDSSIFSITFNADNNKLTQTENEVRELAKTLTNATYNLYIKTEIREDFKEDMLSMSIIGNIVSIFLLAIGLLNFINLMMTGIYSRMREFAVMQSIGVTVKQIRRMLSFEGLYYAFIATGLILTIGSAVMFAESKMITCIADYAIFKYPVLPLVILLACLYILSLIIPFIVYKSSAKLTITERLRDIEN